MPEPPVDPDGRPAENVARGQRALEWLNTYWSGSKQCPICESRGWTILDVVEVRPFTADGVNPAGHIYVMVPVMCNTCKYTWQFNASATDILGAGGGEPG
jgi:hypothetical protein